MKIIKVPDISRNRFEYDFTTLKNVIQEYKENPTEIITVKTEVFTQFSLHSDEFHYVENIREITYYLGKLSSILKELGYFNFIIKQDIHDSRYFFPQFLGDMENSFIKFERECYMSGAEDLFINIYSWLELFLKRKPEKIRCEFWMTYYNTSAYRRILTFIKALDKYYQETKADVRVYWYDSDSIDIRNDGEDLNKQVSLDIELITVEESLWEKMNK